MDALRILRSSYQIAKAKNRDFTTNHYVDILKGSGAKKIKEERHDQLECYGLFKSMDKSDVLRFFQKMISDGYLKEEMKVLQYDNIAAYIRIGDKARDFLPGRIPFEFPLSRRKSIQKSDNQQTNNPASQNRHQLSEIAYEALLEVSKTISKELGVNYQIILSLENLREIANKLPTTKTDFLKIPGISRGFFDIHGKRYLEQTKIYKQMLDEQIRMQQNDAQNANLFDDIDDDFEMEDDSQSMMQSSSKSNGKSNSRSSGSFKRKAGNFNYKSKYFKKKKTSATGNKTGSFKNYKKLGFQKKKDSW